MAKRKMRKSCPSGKHLVKPVPGVAFCASNRRKRKTKNKGNMAGLRKACAKLKRIGFTGKRKNLKAACAAI